MTSGEGKWLNNDLVAKRFSSMLLLKDTEKRVLE